jgi:hypothetical protein
MAEVGKAGPRNGTDIAHAENGDSHGIDLRPPQLRSNDISLATKAMLLASGPSLCNNRPVFTASGTINVRFPGQSSTGVIVMGPFRSGTSLVSGILANLGVFFGSLAETSPPPDRYNPLGYFQRRELISANTRYIASAGRTLASPGPPDALLVNGDCKILTGTSVSWRSQVPLWGMKDPRFTATLHSWLALGCLDADHLRVIRVMRRPEAAAASVMKHREVRAYCGNDFRQAMAMTAAYHTNAAWTAARLDSPVCEIAYESLVANPAQEVDRLADYLGITDAARIRRCHRLVGKRHALLVHYIRKAVSPALLADTVAKTVRTRMRAAG